MSEQEKTPSAENKHGLELGISYTKKDGHKTIFSADEGDGLLIFIYLCSTIWMDILTFFIGFEEPYVLRYLRYSIPCMIIISIIIATIRGDYKVTITKKEK